MKTIIWLLILIGWSVIQARKKAMRERERKARGQGSVARGPGSDVQPSQSSYAQRSSVRTETGMPRELDAIMEYARSRVQSEAATSKVEFLPFDAATQDDEKVTTTVSQPEENEYSERITDHGPRFTPTSLRTFFVMREVLGPPRAKKRFHPRLKAQE